MSRDCKTNVTTSQEVVDYREPVRPSASRASCQAASRALTAATRIGLSVFHPVVGRSGSQGPPNQLIRVA
jgi:hypothetical protein